MPILVLMKRAFRIPIAVKLITVSLSLIVTITLLIAWRSSRYFEKEVRSTHERTLQLQVQDRAMQVESLLQSYIDNLRRVSAILQLKISDKEVREKIEDIVFQSDRDLMVVQVYENTVAGPHLYSSIVDPDYLKQKSISDEDIRRLEAEDKSLLSNLFGGGVEVRSSVIQGKSPLLTLGIPLIKNDQDEITHVVIAKIDISPLQKAFSSAGASEIFLVDKEGRVLAHPKDELAFRAETYSDHPLVLEALESNFRSNHVPLFWNPRDEKEYYGVFSQTIFNVFVVGQIQEAIIREPALFVQRQAFYIGGLILSGSIFLIFLFSISITSPIEKLLQLTYQISRGNFDVQAEKKVGGRDEVKDLAIAFDHMATGLNALFKTQGADVAKTLMASDLENLGGTKKDVVILFCDLRDFTKFSEGHSPEEVVEMLNEYFEEMVTCIEKNQGRVNKFIGDAIMAMWGAPTATEKDAEHAIQAALDMRMSLDTLNKKRIARNQPPIKIGTGLHAGQAVAGTIGSKSRLEYTIIGDAVNQASRIEASTKAFGVDLLISEALADHVKNQYWIELLGSAEVKGKAEPLKMYGVKGYYDSKTQEPIELRTPYSNYKAESADKVKIAS